MNPEIQRTWTLEIGNDMCEITRIHGIVADIQRHYDVSDETAFSITLALDELLTNTISYGYQDDSSHMISVRVDVTPPLVMITITDDGLPFNPLAAPRPDIDAPLEERRIGGLGIHLVRNLMDDINYERRNDSNIVRLIKRLGGGVTNKIET